MTSIFQKNLAVLYQERNTIINADKELIDINRCCDKSFNTTQNLNKFKKLLNKLNIPIDDNINNHKLFQNCINSIRATYLRNLSKIDKQISLKKNFMKLNIAFYHKLPKYMVLEVTKYLPKHPYYDNYNFYHIKKI